MRHAFLSLVFLVFPSAGIAQSTWYVDQSGSGNFTGIQQAIDDAQVVNGDTVIVRDGAYVENINFNGKAITLKSENGPATTVIDGNQAGSVVTFDSGEGINSIIEGFTVTNGNSINGGGVCCISASPSIKFCTFKDNTATGYGGGMSCNNSSPILEDCTFADNTTTGNAGGMSCYWYSSPTLKNCAFTSNMASNSGGGMYCYRFSSPTMDNCAFSNNTAWEGGGLFVDDSSPALNNCTFTNNVASLDGGGMSCDNSSPILEDCTFTANTADSGGGMLCYASPANLENCTFTNNTSQYYGGGIFSSSSSPTLANCTFTTNDTNYRGGGMYCFSSSPTLDNCTFTNNAASFDGGGIFWTTLSSSTLDNCTFSDNTATRGGGIFCDDFRPLGNISTLDNCTFTNNTASTEGGGIYYYSTILYLDSCILWGNNAPQSPEIYVYGGGPNVTYSDVKGGWSGTGNIDVDPLFVDPANGDVHLQSGSPCIDTGNPNSPLDPDGTRTDMGAFYYNQAPPPDPTLSITSLSAGQSANIQVTDTTPGKLIYTAYSLAGGGPSSSPWGDLALSPPYFPLRKGRSDTNGFIQWQVFVPAGASGIPIWAQAFDVARRKLSNGLALTIQ